MEESKLKILLKYIVIGYALYLLYALPKDSWEAGINMGSGDKIYYPKQCLYIQYAVAWWIDLINRGKFSDIIDEHVLAKIGIKFED